MVDLSVHLDSAISRRSWVYTDYMYENIDSEKIRNTGLYNGEGSILYAYCLLYRNGETEYIKYAKRHAVVLKNS